MSESESQLRRRIRRWVRPLASTPLHPQWLLNRRGPDRYSWATPQITGRVLDVGCADGPIRNRLAAGVDYVGLDYPATADGLYRTKPQVFGSAERLPFCDACFDTVVILDVLEHIASPTEAIGELARVTKPGGILLLTIPYGYPLHDAPHDYQRLTRFALQRSLASAGFGQLDIQEVGTAHHTAGLARSLSLANWVLRAVSAPGLRSLMIPVALALIPVTNLLGALLAGLFPVSDFFPMGYRVRAERRR